MFKTTLFKLFPTEVLGCVFFLFNHYFIVAWGVELLVDYFYSQAIFFLEKMFFSEDPAKVLKSLGSLFEIQRKLSELHTC